MSVCLRTSGVIAIAVLAGGCAPTPPVPAPSVRGSPTTLPAAAPASPQYVDELLSPFAPRTTARVAADAIDDVLHLSSDRVATRGDAAGLSFAVAGPSGSRVNVLCRAIVEHGTRVVISSDLPPERHAAVIEAVRSALSVDGVVATPPTTAPAAEAKAVEAAPMRSATLSTDVPPLEATARIHQGLLRSLQLTNRNFNLPGAGGGFGGGGGPMRVEPDGDLFSSGFQATTFGGGMISVDAEWVSDNQTSVTVSSSLPPAQHERLVAEAEKALRTPAKAEPD